MASNRNMTRAVLARDLAEELAQAKKRIAELEGAQHSEPEAGGGDDAGHYLERELETLMRTDPAIFRFLQESALDGLWYWDLEHPEHEWMNSEFWFLFGYDPSEKDHLASEWQDMIHPEDLEATLENFHKHLADPEYPYDLIVRYRHRNGSTVWVRCRGMAIRDEAGRPVRMLGAHTDVTDLKRTEERLRESRQQLLMAQELARLGSWSWDQETGRIVWSDEVYRIFGRDRSLGPPSFEEYQTFQHPEDSERVAAAIALALETGGEYRVEHRIVCAGGEVKHVSAIGRVRLDAEGAPAGLFGTVQDITERTLAGQALSASEQQMRAMAEASHDALIMIDAYDTIRFWSTAAERMFGWSREEALGRKMHKLITPPEYHEEIARGLEAFAISGTGPVMDSVMEFPAVRRDGEVFPVERAVTAYRSGGEYFAVGSLRDITRRKAREEALRESEERLSLAVDGTGIGLWDWRVQTGKAYFNDQWAAIAGYGIAELEPLGIETWTSLCHPDDLEESARRLEEHFAGGSEYYECEVRMRHKDGHWVWVLDRGKVFERDESGRPVRMAGTHLDITRRKLAEAELERLATTDGLTGLPNRRHFLETLERDLERSARYRRPMALLMFDLDHFKQVNDTHGHDAGDEVLRAVARLCRSVLREADTPGRLGGEEFAVSLPETDEAAAMQAAERLRAAVEQAVIPHAGLDLTITVSLGVALPEAGSTDAEGLLKQADLALYEAKKGGRNRAVLRRDVPES